MNEGRLTIVSAAFFARGILDWVETRRMVVKLAARLLRDIPDRSTVAIGNPSQRQDRVQEIVVNRKERTCATAD